MELELVVASVVEAAEVSAAVIVVVMVGVVVVFSEVVTLSLDSILVISVERLFDVAIFCITMLVSSLKISLNLKLFSSNHSGSTLSSDIYMALNSNAHASKRVPLYLLVPVNCSISLRSLSVCL